MKFDLYHSTNQEIEKINEDGVFGSFLFFGNERSGRSHGDIVYKIEVSEEEFIFASSIFYEEGSYELLKEFIEEVQELCDCDEQTAMNLLDESEKWFNLTSDYENAGEIDWDIQRLTALCAKKMGYRGVRVSDEHGGSWMIDMLNKEQELLRIEG